MVELAVGEGVRALNYKINEKLTPRSKRRLPKDTSQKVTWNLKRATQNEQASKYGRKIWVVKGGKWSPNEYWKYLEFGRRYMKPRPFLRQWIIDFKGYFLLQTKLVLRKLLK